MTMQVHFQRALAGLKRLRAVASLGLAGTIAVGVVAGGSLDALAQTVNCQGLQAQIAALGRARPPANSARFARAAQRQQAEIAKTAAHAASIGCNRRQFLFFGEAPPPQCGQINARIARMQANLGQLRNQAGGNFEENRIARQRMLVAQYDSYCRSRVASAREPNFFDRLFGNQQPDYREVPIGPPPEDNADREEEERGPRRGSKAVCVRKCDGGFFPVSYSARNSNLDDLAELCTALCPNTETVLFTTRMDAEIDDAVSVEGESYTALANAGKFKTKFNPACTCKPANQSWVEALAKAEKLLGNKSRRDLIVTPEKADELSRPKMAAAARTSKRNQKAAEAELERERAAQEKADKDEAAQVARNQAGITYGRGTIAHFGLHAGKTETIEGPGGKPRKVRVIDPRL